MKKIIASIGILALAAAASASPPRTAPAPGAAQTPSLSAEQNASADLSGKVVESMNAAGYTYVCLEKKGKKTWVAVPETKVAKGSTMSFLPGQTMTNFSSKSLNRTFDTIVFSAGPASASAAGTGAEAMPAGHPEVPGAAQMGAGSKGQVAEKAKAVKVPKAAGPNGYTVNEIYAKRTALHRKTVAVRGKVVKVSLGIMGKNWVHLQDGTGDQKKGTYDLVATTQDAPAVGDIVTATGVFAKDKDFGAGYLYKAIVEDAKIAN